MRKKGIISSNVLPAPDSGLTFLQSRGMRDSSDA